MTCPVCNDEATPEPCPECEVADSFDDVPLTAGQQAMLDAANKRMLGVHDSDFMVKDEGDFVFVTPQTDRARALMPTLLQGGYVTATDDRYASAPAITADLKRNGYSIEEA